jgi:dTDP-4-dehydrorhamnose 3,5-epimerase
VYLNSKTINVIDLEKHQTKDVVDNHTNGSLTVIWRDWDEIISDPKMVYVSYVNPSEIKGPHIHTKRESYFICIYGEVVFIAKDNDGNYVEVKTNSEFPKIIHIPKNIPSAHINLSKNPSAILALADISWKPNDDEMHNVNFEDYDWGKWSKNPNKIS